MKIVDIIYRYEARDTSASLRPSHTDAALRRLEDGNKTFAALFESTADQNVVQCIVPVDSRELGLSSNAGEGPKQHPFAVILGCSDARVPIELIFNEGPNDLFVIRVAGNIVASSKVGSVEFAAERFGTPLVVVLGHSQCGAVSATLEELMRPMENQSRNLRSIVDRIRPSVEVLLATELRHDSDALVRQAIRANVRVSANHLRHGSEILEQLIQREGLLVVGAEYSLETGVVEFFDGLPAGC